MSDFYDSYLDSYAESPLPSPNELSHGPDRTTDWVDRHVDPVAPLPPWQKTVQPLIPARRPAGAREMAPRRKFGALDTHQEEGYSSEEHIAETMTKIRVKVLYFASL